MLFPFLQELLSYVSTHAKMNVTLSTVHQIYDTLFCEVYVLDEFFVYFSNVNLRHMHY